MLTAAPARALAASLCLAVALGGLGGCRPVRSDAEWEAMRLTEALRAALAEAAPYHADAPPRDVAHLCRTLRHLRNGAGAAAPSAGLLPATWLDEPPTTPGRHAGYRFVVTAGARGIVAVPDHPGARAGTAYYARLPTGLYERAADGFTTRDGDPAPDIAGDRAWRQVRAIR